MNYYTAEYRRETEHKTFRADNLEDAVEHAVLIGWGERPTKVREATPGEIEGAKAEYKRHAQALRCY
jgi:hypothetical protein